ncbi:hypothetical protein R70006_05011 [Paraburkholderia domus]|uniref:hypothetical protein n=1 Tax=Paraburkholderia domus TaxID=2793075 RepID=UPI00191280A7|nr:hypothetical protein [Paraburkholderia domus]MBK5051753.1 hypothetical protein [Burkholderia sp. R-70006]CAE6794586.1 hypothetical protein R70006_05011 [Paraburkholderia domus]
MTSNVTFQILPLLDSTGISLRVRLSTLSVWFLPQGAAIDRRIAALHVADPEQTNATVLIEPRKVADAEVDHLCFFITDGATVAEVATVRIPDAASPLRGSPSASDLAELKAAVQEAYQAAIFDAIGKLHEQRLTAAASGIVAPAAGLAIAGMPGVAIAGNGQTLTAPSPDRWITPGRAVFAVVVLIGLCLVAYGALKKPAQQADPLNPLAASIDPQMTARIQQQIQASLGKPAAGGGILPGQSVTLDTLHAMGLETGKANTGCLVGVRK